MGPGAFVRYLKDRNIYGVQQPQAVASFSGNLFKFLGGRTEKPHSPGSGGSGGGVTERGSFPPITRKSQPVARKDNLEMVYTPVKGLPERLIFDYEEI